MLNKNFWTRQYRFKLNKELKDVLVDMWPYVIVMIVWYCVIPIFINALGDWLRLLSMGDFFINVQTYLLTPLFWSFMWFVESLE